jgi:integrase
LEDENDNYVNPWKKCFNRIEHYVTEDIKKSSREGRPLEYGEFGTLLEHCNNNNWSQRFLVLALFIGFCTGMRRSEVLNLRYGDVDHNKDWITIPKEKIDKKRKARGEKLGRVIPIPQCLSLAILNFRYHVAKEYKPDEVREIGDDNKTLAISDDTKIFAHYRGKPWTAFALEQALKILIKKSGIKQFTFHSLRHTARNRTSSIFSEPETYWMYGWLPDKKMSMHYAAEPTDHNRETMKIKLNMLSVGMSGDIQDWDYDVFAERQARINHYYEWTYPLEYIKRFYSMIEPRK